MITVHYFHPNHGGGTKHTFNQENVKLSNITNKADQLGYGVFHAYEHNKRIGYGTKWADGWSFTSEETWT